MKPWLAFVLLLASCSGCAHMEDMMFGPDPYVQGQPWASSNACAAPVVVNVAQTQEPELLQVRK